MDPDGIYVKMHALSANTVMEPSTRDSGLCMQIYHHPDMMYFKDRLQTFKRWPKQIIPNKYNLARAGLYYTGETDKVICFACGIVLSQWERTDEAWSEHTRWSPKCTYLQMIGYDSIDGLLKDELSEQTAIPCKTSDTPVTTFGGLPVFWNARHQSRTFATGFERDTMKTSPYATTFDTATATNQ